MTTVDCITTARSKCTLAWCFRKAIEHATSVGIDETMIAHAEKKLQQHKAGNWGSVTPCSYGGISVDQLRHDKPPCTMTTLANM